MMTRHLLICLSATAVMAQAFTAEPAASADAVERHRTALKDTHLSTEELCKVVIAIAESGRKEAHDLLKDFFGNEESMASLESRVSSSGRVDRTDLGRVLNAFASSKCPFAEDLLHDTLTQVPTFGPLRFAPHKKTQRAKERVAAFGYLQNPSDKTYDLLEEMLRKWFSNDWGWAREVAGEAMAHIGTDRAKDVLMKCYVLRCEKGFLPDIGKPEKDYVPDYLGEFRDKRAIFDLMLTFWRTYGDRERIDHILRAILSGEPSYIGGNMTEETRRFLCPGAAPYERVRAEDAALYVKAIDSFLADPGKARLDDMIRERFRQIRADMVKKDEQYRKTASEGANGAMNPVPPH